MSHELDVITGTNEAAVISVRHTPWHRLGKVLAEHPSLDEALRLAGLAWEVKKVPHEALIEIACSACGGEGYVRGGPCWLCEGARTRTIRSKSKDAYSVVRMDRHEVIGTVGSYWAPLQNEEAFGVLRPLLDTGLANIETAGSLRRGKDVWMMVAFDQQEIVRRVHELDPEAAKLAEEIMGEILPFGLFTNNHSGEAKARIKETAIRVVCHNTYSAAMGSDEQGTSVEVSHSGDVAANYEAAANLMLQGVAKRWAAMVEAKRTLQATELTRDAFHTLVLEPAVPIRHLELRIQRRDVTSRTKGALEKAHTRRQGIADRWERGVGQTGDRSAWEAYQGFVEWADHDLDAIPGLKAGNSQAAEKRAVSLHTGVLGQLKGRIARRLLDYAVADEDKRAAILAR
jgi:phage/plasmid-like protein (TIGR03299 family)